MATIRYAVQDGVAHLVIDRPEKHNAITPTMARELRDACREVDGDAAVRVATAVPVELHLFAAGGHGFGLRGAAGKPVALWPELFWHWAAARRWV